MKKFLAVILAVMMVVALGVTCFADVAESPKKNPDGSITINTPDGDIEVPGGDVIITPIGDKDKTDNTDAKDALEETKEELENKKLEDLIPGIDNIGDLVVRDIIDVRVDDDFLNGVDTSGDTTYTVTIDLGLKDGDPIPTIVIRTDDGKWVVIDPSDVHVNPDGTVTIKTPVLGTIVTLVPKTQNGSGNKPTKPGVTSPQTGARDYTTVIVACGAMIVLAGAAVVAVKAKATNK